MYAMQATSGWNVCESVCVLLMVDVLSREVICWLDYPTYITSAHITRADWNTRDSNKDRLMVCKIGELNTKLDKQNKASRKRLWSDAITEWKYQD